MFIRSRSVPSLLVSLIVLLAAVTVVTVNAHADTVTWTNSSGGSWSDPSNWADTLGQHRVPGLSDQAIVLGGAYTVVLDVDDEITALALGNASGGPTLNIPAGKTLRIVHDSTINGGTINNAGNLLWHPVSFFDVALNNGAVINNLAGGVFDMQSEFTFTWSGSVNGSTPSGTQPKIINTAGGIIRLSGDTTGNVFDKIAFNNSGTIDAEAGALYLGGTVTLNTGSTFTGPAGCNITGNCTATGTMNVNTAVQLLGATLSGTQTWAGTGSLQWAGGTLLGAGTTTIPAGFHLNIPHFGLIDGHTLSNFGITTITGSFVTFDDGGAIINQPGALVDIHNGAEFNWQGHGTNPHFNNAAGATVRVSVGTSTGQFTDVLLANSGQLEARTGTMNLNHNNLGGGGVLLNDGSVLTGPGAFVMGTGRGGTPQGGTRTFNGTITVNTTLILDGASDLRGSHTLRGTGSFQWHGKLLGPGTTTFASGFHVLDISCLVDGRTVNNAGTVTLEPKGYVGIQMQNGAVFNNLSGGLVDVQLNDARIAWTGVGALPVFNNLTGATVRKSAGGAEGGFQNVNTVNNGGTFESRSGTFDLSRRAGATGGGSFLQKSGQLILNGGSFAADVFTLQGGLLIGSGTVVADVTNSGGVISPGRALGVITIDGNYTQGATGNLNVDIGGTAPGTGFDQLKVTRSATLNGKLNVTLINGFHPASTSRFPVVTYASHTGTFSSVTSPFVAQYTATTVLVGPGSLAPTITGFTPSGGAAGASVTINGTNLTGASVSFNGVRATVDTARSTTTRLVVTVPTGATSGAIKVVTPAGSATSRTPFTVALSISGTLNSGTAPIPGVSGPVPNAPVFLVNRTNPAALAAVVANPALLAGNAALIQRTATNAAGQYSFVVQPGSYDVVPALPGVSFTPSYKPVTITTASVANQNFVAAAVDNTAPTVRVISVGTSSMTGSAADSGSGILTVVATLQNPNNQYLNWQVTSGAPQFTSNPIVGSFRLASATGSASPLLNPSQVNAQNWTMILPSNLSKGSYLLTVRAIDRAFRVSVPVVQTITFGSAAQIGRAAVAVSAATATAMTDSIQLNFTGALDAESAGDARHYIVFVDNHRTTVESAAYNAAAHTVTLALAAGSLNLGALVQVTWSGIQDAAGLEVGGSWRLTAR